VKKYADYIGIVEFSPHRLRHTKAMHLTEANINPIFIRDFLGHTDLKVTEIYSKTSIKMKKAALGKLNNSAIPDKTGSEWTDDENLMEWLTSLGR
jgi:integrase